MVRRIQRTRDAAHPTKVALLEAVVRLLDTVPIENVTIDMVLEAANASRSSLYHHYGDFPSLLEQALVTVFSHHVDESIEMLARIFDAAGTQREFADGLNGVTRITQSPDRAARRMQRVVIFANGGSSAALRDLLGAEQQRLTDAQAKHIIRAQERGWINASLHPEAIAAFIQAYTLGRVVDDINPHPVPPHAWIELIDRVVADVLLAPDPETL